MDRRHATAQIDRGPLRLGPRSTERPADAGWTLTGGIDDPDPVRVDRGGSISRSDATWRLDWWIGADDRWYLPAREPSVRQRRNGPGPIIETSLRVPSGDVVATAYPVVAGGGPATVLEVANASPVPVVLAVAIRPGDVDGRTAPSQRIDVAGGAITVDGRPAVHLPRSPNERVASDSVDVLGLVEAGHELAWPEPVEGRWANAACLYPLPHGTSLRFVVPADGGAGPIAVDAVPPSDTVSSGWAAVVDRAGSFGFPDPGLTELVGAARARLVLAASGLPDGVEAIDHGAAKVLEALAVAGHGADCRPALHRLADAFPTRLPADTANATGPEAGAAMVRAAAAGAELLDPSVAESLLESVAQLTSLVERKGDGVTVAVTKLALARLAVRAGQPEAAQHLASTAARPAVPDRTTLGHVTDLAGLASPAGSWPPDDDAVTAARFVTAARGLLLEVGQGAATGAPDRRPVIDLLPVMPSAWLGGEVEVHRAPAAGVLVSFAIRWHGYRPALLWEIHDEHGVATPVLRCPGLDPEWSTGQRSGETLLAGTAIELPDAPAPGDSFQ